LGVAYFGYVASFLPVANDGLPEVHRIAYQRAFVDFEVAVYDLGNPKLEII
jgi:hypothetical protein